MIDVWIADDHPIVRAGLRHIVADVASIRVVGESADADDLLAKIQGATADVLLLDASMPGPGVFELLHRLAENRPDLRVLVLGDHPVEHVALRMLQHGASGPAEVEAALESLCLAFERAKPAAAARWKKA